MLVIGVSKLTDSHVNVFCEIARTSLSGTNRKEDEQQNAESIFGLWPDHHLRDVCATARTPSSDFRKRYKFLNAQSIVGLGPEYQGIDPNDGRAVARETTQTDCGCNSDSLNVGNDIGSRIEQGEVGIRPL